MLLFLSFAWGNHGYAAGIRYLKQLCSLVPEQEGHILECGSGVSTLLLGILADKHGKRVHTLENNVRWHDHVQRVLKRHAVKGVTMHLAPLRDYNGKFTWYDAPLHRITNDVSMVVCDGPPSRTQGGRYGLLPVMRSRLRDDCVILLDDTWRQGERDVLSLWEAEKPFSATRGGMLATYSLVFFS